MVRLKEFCKKYTIPLIILADVLGLLTAAFHVSFMDIISFDLRYWVPQFQQTGYLSMYHGISEFGIFDGTTVNYPPMYPSYVYLLSCTVLPEIGEITLENAVNMNFQVAMKSFAFIGLMISQVVLYKRISPKAALLWTYCLPIWYMSFVWGQRDAVMGFFIVMMLFSMHKGKLYEPGFWFVAICLLKPQGAYLVVIYLLYLFVSDFDLTAKIKCFAIDLAIGLAAYLPFMIYEQDIFLPFKLYLGVADYGVADFSWQTSNIFWMVCGMDVPSNAVWLLPVLFVCVCVLTVLWYRKTHDIVSTGFVYLFCLYMFTIGQHDRYVLYHICVLVLLCVLLDNYMDLYFSTSAVFGATLCITNTWITADAFNHNLAENFGSVLFSCFLGFVFNCIFILYVFRRSKKLLSDLVVR